MAHHRERLQRYSSPNFRLCRLDCTRQAQRLIQPGKHQGNRTIPARGAAVNWKFVDIEGEYPRARRVPWRKPSAAGDAHVAADARTGVPAVDDEVVALRFQADGAVDRQAEELIVGGRPQRLAQIGGILVAEAGM